LTAFSAQELMMLIGQASFLIANDYEMRLLQEKTTWDMQELLQHVPVVITTLGEKGSIITTKEKMIEIPPCPPDSVDDPTGAGDAYRAGFFTGHANGFDLETCGRMGSVAATYTVEAYGTQTHTFTKDAFIARYKETYGTDLVFA
ncbi:MAG TPA: PfkB family carbohydrate kinase, partial [Candidatus Kapabacteria bacterium]|nr:PfkB family carbohydrate kinase [Candidatus Kapabacteria bacterium]